MKTTEIQSKFIHQIAKENDLGDDFLVEPYGLILRANDEKTLDVEDGFFILLMNYNQYLEIHDEFNNYNKGNVVKTVFKNKIVFKNNSPFLSTIIADGVIIRKKRQYPF